MKKRDLKTFSLPSFLKEEYWLIHEAAYVLIGEWPSSFYLCQPSYLSPEVMKRPKFYCYLGGGFAPSLNEKDFWKMYRELVDAVSSGELLAYPERHIKEDNIIVKPETVILWALKNNKMMSNDLWNLYGLEYINVKSIITYEKKVRIQTEAQLLLLTPSFIAPGKLIDQLARKHGLTEKTISNDLKELFDEKGKPGRPSKCQTASKSKERRFTLKPLLNVMRNDSSIVGCNPKLLRAVVKEVVLNVFGSNNRFLHVPVEYYQQISREIEQNPVMQIYLESTPSIIQNLIRNEIANCLPPQEMVKDLSQSITIGDILGLAEMSLKK